MSVKKIKKERKKESIDEEKHRWKDILNVKRGGKERMMKRRKEKN